MVMAVASIASGALAIGGFAFVREYRENAFVSRASFQADTTAALLRRDVEADDIQDRLAAFGETLAADVVAVDGDSEFISAPHLSADVVPQSLIEDPESAPREIALGGHRYRVVGRVAEESDTRLYFFFARDELWSSLRELATILAAGWVVVTAAAAVAGSLVARRTLRPVRTAADAAHAVAEGLLDTRLVVAGSDEFATMANAFNEMAQALQAKIDQLSAAHDRERRFTGDVTHELMTPLGAVVTEASVLEAHLEELPPEARRMAELLVADVRRLRTLVEELLELARADAATQVAPDSEQPIGALLVTLLQEGGYEDVVLSGELDAHIAVNTACLTRVVSNLLQNAHRHGAPPVEVHVERLGSGIRISVRDHGPGIEPQDLPHLFDRFYKADESRSERGAGLGLAIASEYTRLLAGHLRAENHPGGGAVFTLSVPPVVTRS
jgi:two-component system sensor histidine kinase MtrB